MLEIKKWQDLDIKWEKYVGLAILKLPRKIWGGHPLARVYIKGLISPMDFGRIKSINRIKKSIEMALLNRPRERLISLDFTDMKRRSVIKEIPIDKDLTLEIGIIDENAPRDRKGNKKC